MNLLFWTWIVAHAYYVNLKYEPIVAAKEPGLLGLEVSRRDNNNDDCGEFRDLESPLRSLILQKSFLCYLMLL